MRKYEVVIEVDETVVISEYIANNKDAPTAPDIQEAIKSEFVWLGQSGIYLKEIVKEITE